MATKLGTIEVDNSGGNSLTGYETLVTIPYDSSLGPNFQYLEIRDDDDTTVLPHWIETVNGTTDAEVYVSVDVNAGEIKTLPYYSNQSSPPGNNGANVFEVFENFAPSTGGFPDLHTGTVLNLPTPGGSNDVVHTSVIDFEERIGSKWNGWRYWMAYTPYPGNDDQKENPNIAVSNDGTTWQEPSGISNPLYPSPGSPDDYFSDTELAYNESSGELHLYVRKTVNQSSSLQLATSSDGVTWSSLTEVLPSIGLSPSIINDGGSWKYWDSVINGGINYRTSSDGVNWSSSTTATVSNDWTKFNQDPWHLNVVKIDGNYLALYDDSTSSPEGRTGSDIWVATSSNGSSWTRLKDPLFAATEKYSPTGDDDPLLYRVGATYNSSSDQLDAYISATPTQGAWDVIHKRIDWSSAKSAINNDVTSNWSTNWSKSKAIPTGATDYLRRKWEPTELKQQILDDGVNETFSRPAPGSGYIYEVDWFDDSGNTSSWLSVLRLESSAGLVGLGVYTGANQSNYIFHDTAFNYQNTSVTRTKEYHKLEIEANENGDLTARIDGEEVASNFDTIDPSSILVGGFKDNVGWAYFSCFRVRQYVSSPPTTSVSTSGPVSGSLSVTDGQEVVSASGGSTITTGTLALTDRGEILSLEGQATVNAISGTLSITNGRQSVSLSGETENEGSLSVTDAGEVLSLEGESTVTAITGTLFINDAGESVSLAGATKNQGTLNLTDRGERLVLLESEPPRLAVLDARLVD